MCKKTIDSTNTLVYYSDSTVVHDVGGVLICNLILRHPFTYK